MSVKTQVDDLVRRYASKSGFRALRQDSATRLEVERGELVVEVVVPDDAHEWFATVRSAKDAAVVVEDWMDHYRDGPSDHTDLDAEMIAEVDSFLTELLTLNLKLSVGEKTILQAEVGGRWFCILPFGHSAA